MYRIIFHYLLLFLVARVDYSTGAQVKLGSIYLLIIAMASWNLGPRALILFVAASVMLWSRVEWLNGVRYATPLLQCWNITNRLGVVAITASMVFKAKVTLKHQQHLIRELRQTLLKISQFKELVPVCRICHQSHLDPEYQTKLDEILRDDAERETIGGICPGCMAERAARVDHIPVESYLPAPAPAS